MDSRSEDEILKFRAKHLRLMEGRLFLPHWWVQNYDWALEGRFEDFGEVSLQAEGLIIPRHSPFQLYILSFILSDVQSQIMINGFDSEWVVVRPSQIVRKAGGSTKLKQRQIFNYIYIFSTIKVLSVGEDGSLKPVALFRDETWSKDQEGLKFTLRLAPCSREFFLGLSFPGELGGSNLSFMRTPQFKVPLNVWRSVWLDSVGIETSIVARIEKAMQWSYNCLNVDGTYSESMSNLFKGLDSELGYSMPFKRKVLVLTKVFGKLSDHGYLSRPRELGYMAFEAKKRLEVLWDASEYRNSSKDLSEYLGHIASFLVDRVLTDDQIQQICFSFTSNKVVVQKFVKGFSLAMSADPALKRKFLLFEGGAIMPLALLCLEWAIRASDGVKLPLVKLEGSFSLYETLPKEGSTQDEFFQSIADFINIATSHPNLTIDLEEVKLLSLWSPISSKQISKSVQATPRRQKSSAIHSGFRGNAELESEPKMPVDHSNTQATELKTLCSEITIEPRNKDNFKVWNRAKAHEALYGLKKKPTKYQELTREYLATVDENSKRLILDIKNRMQPTIFEKHMDQRLVGYLLENPDLVAAEQVQNLTH